MRRVSFYRNYHFIEQDPIVPALKTITRDEHLKPSEAHEITGLATQTITNWLNGKTRRPQNASSTNFAAALGYARHDELLPDGTVVPGYKKVRDLDWKEEAEKQADWMLRTADRRAAQKEAEKKAAQKKKRSNGHR